MSEQQPDPQQADPQQAGPQQAGPQPSEPGEQKEPTEEQHDPTGLGLARAIAGSVAGSRYRRKRRRPDRPIDPQSAGAHPDGRDPQLLGAALDRMVESQGWSKEIDVRMLLGKWPSLVGPVNAAHSTPISYAETVLTVRTDSTAWATSLRTMAPQLVAKLNQALGDGTVTRVDIRGPEAPSWKKGRRSVRDGRGPRDTYG